MQTRDEMPAYVTVYASTDDLDGSLRRAGGAALDESGRTPPLPREATGMRVYAMLHADFVGC